MKYLKYVFFLLLMSFIALATYIAVQPNDFSVTRTRTINAPAEVIFNTVNEYKNWPLWSSWVEKEPSIKITFPEFTKGEGSSYSWKDKNGVGTMKTIAIKANKSINQIMQIGDYPESKVSWKFKPNPDGSADVTWSISGDNLPFNFKAYNVYAGGIEKQIGPDYERSLEKLDSVVVSNMKKFSIVVSNETTQHSGGFYIYISASSTFNNFKSEMAIKLSSVIAYAEKNNISTAGAPYILYDKWDEKNNTIVYSCCLPTTNQILSTGEISTGQLQPFKAVKTTLIGDYSNLKEAWDKATKAITNSGLKQEENGPNLEAYINSPINTPNPANLKTEIYIAVK